MLRDAAGVLERLQEIRTALGSAKEETAEAAPSGAEPEPVEEVEGEVSGSVTEEGRPVEGATVADPETGATATTDADGLFKLAGVPAGRLVALTATKAGKPLGVRRVFLTGGRAALADFGGAASVPATAGGVRLRPSIMRVRSAAGQATGLILGEVRDARGRPGLGRRRRVAPPGRRAQRLPGPLRVPRCARGCPADHRAAARPPAEA